MKQNKRFWVLITVAFVLGFIPAMIGLVRSLNGVDSAEPTLTDMYQQYNENVQTDYQDYKAEIQHEEMAPTTQTADTAAPELVLPPPPDINEIYPTAGAPEKHWYDELTLSNWISIIGLIVGVISTLIAILFRSGGDGSHVVNELLQGANDLSKLTIGERLGMFFKSIYDAETKARYRLRKDPGWSVYSAHTNTFSTNVKNRSFFIINRLQAPWDALFRFFGNMGIRISGHESRLFTLSNPSNGLRSDLGLWKIDPYHDLIVSIVNDAFDEEAIIFIVVRDKDNQLKYHGLTSDQTTIPPTLEAWELFIEAFRAKFYFDDKESVLELVFASRPIKSAG